jgi:hypothetical protein
MSVENQRSREVNISQSTCVSTGIHLKKTRGETEVMARPRLLDGSEIRVTTKRDESRTEAAEMRFFLLVEDAHFWTGYALKISEKN